MSMEFVELGTVPFEQGLRMQERTVREVLDGSRHETIYLLEHPHVFTAGRSADAKNLLAAADWDGNPISLVEINRGGDVTYHGPGQLVGYPHLDLRQRGRDVHRFLRQLEDVLIQAAASFGVQGTRRAGLTGVWTDKGKLASIGVGVRGWVTMHGFAFNVSTDLRYFQLINPCGMVDCPMVSLSSLLGRMIQMDEAREAVKRGFHEVFGC